MSYSVDVTITSDGATYHETIPTGDDVPGNVAAAYGLADPLVIKQSLAVNDRLPLSHPQPDEATVTLIGATGATYSKLALGDPVAVLLYPAAAFAGTPVTFYGRIATLDSQPHPLGVIYTLGCFDYTVDLAQLQVGLGAWPLEASQARTSRIFAEAGVGFAYSSFIPWFDPFHPARAAGQTDALSALLTVLDSWNDQAWRDEANTDYTVSNPGAWRMQQRPILVPKITGGLLDTTTPYLVCGPAGAPAHKRVRYAPPARVTNLAGVRTVTVAAASTSPSTGAPILDGFRVEFAPSYSQQKGGDGVGNVVVATSPTDRFVFDWRTVIGRDIPAAGVVSPWWQGVNPTPIGLGGPQVIQELETDLTAAAWMGDVVENWRVPFRPDMAAAWKVGTLSYQAWKEVPWRRPNLTELLTVCNVEAGVLPTGREWIVGLVQATTLTVAKGRTVIDIDLVPNTYDANLQRFLQGSALGVCSMDSPILAGVTLAQLSPRDTFSDYAIVRGS